MRKLLAVLVLGTLVLVSACTRGGDDDSSPEPTDAGPTPTAGVDAVSDFALVGVIDEAFTGPQPDIDIPLDLGDDLDDPNATPGPSPIGGTPADGGIIRLTLDDASDDLTEACGLDTEDVAIVYWTTNTYFEPATVLDNLEDEIEDRASGITGTIYRSSDADTDTDIATPAPTTTTEVAATGSPAAATASPLATATEGPVFEDSNCILIAEQVGFTRTLPTPRPRPVAPAATPRRTATPAPTATATPAPASPSVAPSPLVTTSPVPTGT